ncbi:nitrilase [Peziza echinospora]|nr:nitrilase [Peziza echinospora]
MPIAACGQFCAVNSIVKNLNACTLLVKKAVAAKAKVLFLPEASDYISSSPAESLALCVPASKSLFVRGLQQLAKDNALPINVGIHEPAPDGERVRNVSVWIDEKGEITKRYQKVHVFDVDIEGGPRLMESKSTEPGSLLTPPFPTPLGRLGMLICFDLRFPEPSISLLHAGAQLLSYPSAFTVPTGRAHWSTLLRARAIENQCFVLAAAQIGKHNQKRISYGGSMIIDPWGKLLSSCNGIDDDKELETLIAGEDGGTEDQIEICTAELDLEVLEKIRREVPMKRRFDVYAEL